MINERRSPQLSLVQRLEEQRAPNENKGFCAHIKLFPGPFSVFQEWVDDDHEQTSLLESPGRLGIMHWSKSKGVLYVAPREEDPLFLYGRDDQTRIRESGLCALVETEHFPVIVEEGNDDTPMRRVLHLYAGKPVINRLSHRRVYHIRNNVQRSWSPSLSPGLLWALQMQDSKNRLRIGRENITDWQQLYRGIDARYTVVDLGWQDCGVIIGRERDPLFAYTAEQRQHLDNAGIDCIGVIQEIWTTSEFSQVPYFDGRKGFVNSVYGVPLKMR